MASVDQVLHAFGRRLASLRRKAGFTQEELAGRSGVSPKYLSEVERGVTNPSLSVMHKLATGLGVRLPRLLAEPGNMELEIATLLASKNKAEQAKALALLTTLFAPPEGSGGG